MSSRRYTAQELEQILLEFESGTSLTELAGTLNRPSYGIALKMLALSQENPSIWNPDDVKKYTREEVKAHRGDVKGQKRRWKIKNRGESTVWTAETRDKIDWDKFRTFLNNYLEGYAYKKDFAAEMGIHPSLLSHYLAGRLPSYQFFRKMSEMAQISYEEFEANFIQLSPNQP